VKYTQIFIEYAEGNGPLGIPRHRLENSFRIDLKGVGWEVSHLDSFIS
jgi:hypothetical protein